MLKSPQKLLTLMTIIIYKTISLTCQQYVEGKQALKGLGTRKEYAE